MIGFASSGAGQVRAQELDAPMDAAARIALDAYGSCIAEKKPNESMRVLMQDFRTSRYRTGLRLLSRDAERDCAFDAVGRGNRMRSGDLLFAGAVAENLLEQDDRRLNVRLISAGGTDAETYAPTDAVAQCLARSLPDQVAALFATEPASQAETAVARELLVGVEPCSQAAGLSVEIEMSVPALRAIVATATLRLLQHAEDADA
jgi:hypothetical protein